MSARLASPLLATFTLACVAPESTVAVPKVCCAAWVRGGHAHGGCGLFFDWRHTWQYATVDTSTLPLCHKTHLSPTQRPSSFRALGRCSFPLSVAIVGNAFRKWRNCFSVGNHGRPHDLGQLYADSRLRPTYWPSHSRRLDNEAKGVCCRVKRGGLGRVRNV